MSDRQTTAFSVTARKAETEPGIRENFLEIRHPIHPLTAVLQQFASEQAAAAMHARRMYAARKSGCAMPVLSAPKGLQEFPTVPPPQPAGRSGGELQRTDFRCREPHGPQNGARAPRIVVPSGNSKRKPPVQETVERTGSRPAYRTRPSRNRNRTDIRNRATGRNAFFTSVSTGRSTRSPL